MNPLQHRLLRALGALALAAAVAGIGLAQYNASLRRQMGEQQQYLQQSVQLEGLYREMVRALAELAARRNDDDLQQLLGRHGISVSVAPPPTPAAGPAADAKGARK